ncbi:MAG: formate dehydrogenase [Actinobacteria bacterium]|nr:formate dehydrogenase [Actinomycetota bacterium]
MKLPSSDIEADGRLHRFSDGERWVHRSLGVLMAICMLTAAALYFGFVSSLIGYREVVSTIHFASGLLLPVPLIAGALFSAAFRDDVRRLNRFFPSDWRWLRSRASRINAAVGKFNAGQKLNSSFVLGAVVLLFISGLMLRYFGFFADNTRNGATFVHDFTALCLVLVTIGHMSKAWADVEARTGMRTGSVSKVWARVEHPLWAAEIERQQDAAEVATESESD